MSLVTIHQAALRLGLLHETDSGAKRERIRRAMRKRITREERRKGVEILVRSGVGKPVKIEWSEAKEIFGVRDQDDPMAGSSRFVYLAGHNFDIKIRPYAKKILDLEVAVKRLESVKGGVT